LLVRREQSGHVAEKFALRFRGARISGETKGQQVVVVLILAHKNSLFNKFQKVGEFHYALAAIEGLKFAFDLIDDRILL
jgi:hypothetical protein